MALCVCKCLNVTLESDEFEDNVDIRKLELTSTEQRDSFFAEKLLSCPLNRVRFVTVQPALTGTRTVGRWTLNFCLSCQLTTHAVCHDRHNIVVIHKTMQTTPERLTVLKKLNNFSPVFNLLLPEVTDDIEMKENVDTSNMLINERRNWQPVQQAIGSLSKQLTQTLQTELETIEEAVRQFRDLKYAEFEAYKERAQRDHKILTSILNKTRATVNDGWKIDPNADNGPPSPQLPPLQRRRLSSLKDAKMFSKPVINTSKNQSDESLDGEDIFDLEGTDTHVNMISDHEDYDSEPGSNEEGIHIARARGGGAADIARSLPINVPKFISDRPTPSDADDDDQPHDIAANIKALARSVHGDVFELPRPRFSTQI